MRRFELRAGLASVRTRPCVPCGRMALDRSITTTTKRDLLFLRESVSSCARAVRQKARAIARFPGASPTRGMDHFTVALRLQILCPSMDNAGMPRRPLDLPDFVSPPVTEVVLGVQFGTLDRLLLPHLGIVWREFRDKFPEIEEHAPLDATFETFSDNASGQPMPHVRFELLTVPPTPRVFFVNGTKTELLQFQRDRFLHNWRKIGDGNEYPRFERMLTTFEAGFRQFEAVVTKEQLGTIVPNQCEISYINQIIVETDQYSFAALAQIFGPFTSKFILSDLGAPEDARFFTQYIIREKDGPLGRLYISALPARKLDGTRIIQLTLSVRGKPLSPDLSGVAGFFGLGRRHIVRAFAELTTEEMHRVWERKQ